MLDFRELPEDGIAFEQLVREMFSRSAFEVHWTGVGADQQRDLTVIEVVSGPLHEFRRRWLVQCKHFAHSGRSVGISDVPAIVDSCKAVGASGFLLVTSTQPTASLVKRLDEFGSSQEVELIAKFWDSIELERRLSTPDGLPLIHQFFPESAKAYRWRIYNAGSSAFWAANYKTYFFYMSGRTGVFPQLKDAERIVKKLESVPVGKGEYLRPRGIYFDGKNEQYFVFADYMIGKELKGKDLKPALNPKQMNGYLQDGQGLYSEGGAMWYLTFYDVRLVRANMFSDHFHIDHKEYYAPYASNFEGGHLRGQYTLGDLPIWLS